MINWIIWIIALLTTFMALDFFFITVRLTLSEIHRAQAAKDAHELFKALSKYN